MAKIYLAPERPTFLQHYVDYLSSDAGLIAIFVLFAIILYAWTESQRPTEAPLNIPGCTRFGLYNRSNLDTQFESSNGSSEQDQEPRVVALFAYPIKSCGGVEFSAAEVTGLGLKHDRILSFAQLVKKTGDSRSNFGEKGSETHQWRFVTQRERPQMALITTELWIPDPRLLPKHQDSDSSIDLDLRAPDKVNDWTANGGCLIVRFPHTKTLFGFNLYTETVSIKLPLAPTSQRRQAKGYTLEPLSVWVDCPLALNINTEINPMVFDKLKTFLGISNPLALFRVDENANLRTISRSLPSDRHADEVYEVGFGDAFPLSLLNLASVSAVDASLPESSRLKGKLDALRFRANVYISGPPAFAEDSWKRVLIGQAVQSEDGKIEAGEYHIACRTARCTLPNVCQDSGVRDKTEPFATLKRTRVVDEGAKPHSSLGMSVLPLLKRGVVRVGERIEVEEVGVHVYEKMFK